MKNKKKKKHKKGFTLIELLAIIVILAVIMVIAVPKIVDVVKGSKNHAWKNNATMIEKAMGKSITILDPETGANKYSIDNLCSDPEKLKEIVKLNDTNVTCENNVFRLYGKGQFENKLATITCTNNKCKTTVNNDIKKSNPLDSLEVAGYKLEEKFKEDKLTYHVTVEDSSINIDAEKYNELASVVGDGIKNLTWGENVFEITVSGEGLDTKTYTLIVNNQRPTAPVIKGGSNDYSSSAVEISIKDDGESIKGVDYYEYYISDTNVKPDDEIVASGVTTGKKEIALEGTHYIFYRTVSKGGFKSEWSNSQTVKISYSLASRILSDNPTRYTNPTLTAPSSSSSDKAGLYSMSVTGGFGGSDGTTYYFRGNVTNNYVSFAGKTWRIVRINEDGTVRLILSDTINTSKYAFSNPYTGYTYMYYSNSNVAKPTIDSWYNSNIGNNSNYSSKIASGNYFCEQARVRVNDNFSSTGSASMTSIDKYTYNLKCSKDGNGKGLLNLSVGTLTVEEAILAGAYPYVVNTSYYLYTSHSFWSMSPAGTYGGYAARWQINAAYSVGDNSLHTDQGLRPVINLKANVNATGSGTSSNPYVVQ